MPTITIHARMLSPTAAELTERDQLTHRAVELAKQRYEERRPLIDKHANILTDEERQFSPDPFIFPRVVELAVDTFIRSRGRIDNIKQALEHQILILAKQRYPDTDDEFVVQWE